MLCWSDVQCQFPAPSRVLISSLSSHALLCLAGAAMQILVIAVLLTFVMKRRFSVMQVGHLAAREPLAPVNARGTAAGEEATRA